MVRTTFKGLAEIQALPYVLAANPDAERDGAPIDTVEAKDFVDGMSTWDLGVINVTDFNFDNRTVEQTGDGVYVAVRIPAWLMPGGDSSLKNALQRNMPSLSAAEEQTRGTCPPSPINGSMIPILTVPMSHQPSLAAVFTGLRSTV